MDCAAGLSIADLARFISIYRNNMLYEVNSILRYSTRVKIKVGIWESFPHLNAGKGAKSAELSPECYFFQGATRRKSV